MQSVFMIDNVINNDNNVANIDNIGNSMNRHMQQIDHQTGEVVEGFVALIQVNQAEVAEQVGMNRHNVNRSIKS